MYFSYEDARSEVKKAIRKNKKPIIECGEVVNIRTVTKNSERVGTILTILFKGDYPKIRANDTIWVVAEEV